MGKNSGGKIFLKILGFLVLAGGIALIALGLVYIVPDIEILKLPNELYYLIGGVAGLLIAVIFLILGFRTAVGIKEKKPVSNEYVAKKRPDPNAWNTEQEGRPISRPAISEAKAAIRIKEKSGKNSQSIVCQKCGTENAADNYYCSGCKSALRKICKLCGHDNDYGTDICDGCGKLMQM